MSDTLDAGEDFNPKHVCSYSKHNHPEGENHEIVEQFEQTHPNAAKLLQKNTTISTIIQYLTHAQNHPISAETPIIAADYTQPNPLDERFLTITKPLLDHVYNYVGIDPALLEAEVLDLQNQIPANETSEDSEAGSGDEG